MITLHKRALLRSLILTLILVVGNWQLSIVFLPMNTRCSVEHRTRALLERS